MQAIQESSVRSNTMNVYPALVCMEGFVLMNSMIIVVIVDLVTLENIAKPKWTYVNQTPVTMQRCAWMRAITFHAFVDMDSQVSSIVFIYVFLQLLSRFCVVIPDRVIKNSTTTTKIIFIVLTIAR